MSDATRLVPGLSGDALERLVSDMQRATWFRYVGRPVLVRFPGVANTPIDVLHGVGFVPDGVLVLDFPTGAGLVTRAPGEQWSPTIARVVCSTANAVAVLGFFVYREVPKDVTT